VRARRGWGRFGPQGGLNLVDGAYCGPRMLASVLTMGRP
jgi:hypothetical protein